MKKRYIVWNRTKDSISFVSAESAKEALKEVKPPPTDGEFLNVYVLTDEYNVQVKLRFEEL